MDNLTRRLAETIRTYRTEAGLSQEELADRAGLHRTYISLLERGLRAPSVETLAHIGAALQVPASQLLADAETLPS